MLEIIFTTIKDASILIMIAILLIKIKRTKDDSWYILVIAIILLMSM